MPALLSSFHFAFKAVIQDQLNNFGAAVGVIAISSFTVARYHAHHAAWSVCVMSLSGIRLSVRLFVRVFLGRIVYIMRPIAADVSVVCLSVCL